uniref:Thrombospondin-like N-terminal domain-containing protein n=2 Tax=Denticeps clupeoides TaxID=299321 RepID=A0AAY4BPJ2_9TELE
MSPVEDMTALLRWTALLWVVNGVRFAGGMAVNDRKENTCPLLVLEETRFTDTTSEPQELTGFDLTGKFLLRKGPDTEDRPLFRLGSRPLIKLSELVFPDGLPNEYSLVATFRLRKTTKKDRWYLWQIFDKTGSNQVSLVVDGAKKVVEFSTKGLLKNSLYYMFKSRDLQALFDRQWHTLGIAVQTSIISVYLDCKLIERRLTEERSSMDMKGRTLITTRTQDGRPVDIELQEIFIFCDADIAERMNCCEIPGSKCSSLDGPNGTALPTVTSYLPRMLTQPVLPTGDGCQCTAVKGDQGLPGLPGSKGEKGDKVRISFLLPALDTGLTS